MTLEDRLRDHVREATVALLTMFPAPEKSRNEMAMMLEDELSLLLCLPQNMLTVDVFARYIATIEIMCLSDPLMRSELSKERVTP